MNNVILGSFDLYELFVYFFVYSFIGWCSEVVFAAVKHGKFVNRGFLNGPLCPIYGAGAVCILLALTPLQKGRSWDFLAVFACSALLCSALEFFTGFIMEKFFHRKWWDYGDRRFNLMSYVCLEMTLLWGFACLLLMYVLHPAIAAVFSHIPYKGGILAPDGGDRPVYRRSLLYRVAGHEPRQKDTRTGKHQQKTARGIGFPRRKTVRASQPRARRASPL